MRSSRASLIAAALAAATLAPALAQPPGHCPPGLAKKNTGCLPLGQAKKLGIGQPVPPTAVYVVPQPVLTRLPPPPVGYRYAVVGNDVVLVSDQNLVVHIYFDLIG